MLSRLSDKNNERVSVGIKKIKIYIKMPKLYKVKYCVRCGMAMRICKPTFICPDCPLHIADVVDRSHFFDYHTGERILLKIKI